MNALLAGARNYGEREMQGWELMEARGDLEIYRHDQYGMVTVDVEQRIADVGACKPFRFRSIVASSAYRGRNWKARLVADAQAEAARLWAS